MSMDTPTTPHVAILPSPGMGHIIPLLEFAKRLVTDHGFQVSFFVLTTDASTAQSRLIESTSVPDALHIIHLPQADISGLIPPDAEIETRMSVIVKESVPSLKSAVLSKLGRPTALVVDIFGTDAFDIADELNIPKYVFFTSTAMLLALLMYLPMLDKEVQGEYIHLQDPLEIPGCKPTQIDNLVDPLLDRKNDRYQWMLHQASRFPMAEGILINTCEVLEPKTIRALREDPVLSRIPTPRVYPVGPIVRDSEAPPEAAVAGTEEYNCLAWLDQQPPKSVIYVSFGSAGALSPEQMKELAWGLELSQQRFLWVVRPPSGVTSAAAYFTSGGQCGNLSEYLPDGFLTRTQGIGLVVDSWAPQTQILGHAATGRFLTHCGWNSTLESIVYGVPMIAWPLFAEQRLNASALTEDLKLAAGPLGSRHRVLRREEIGRVVRWVMCGEEAGALEERMKEVRDGVLTSLDKRGSSHSSLSTIVKEWKTSLKEKESKSNFSFEEGGRSK